MNLHCPYCDQIDRVQKVSAVYNSGYTSTEASGKSKGITYDGHRYGGVSSSDASINLEGKSQTEISHILAPPTPPRDRGLSDQEIAFGCFVFAFIVLTIGTRLNWWWLIVIGVIFLVLSVLILLSSMVPPPDGKDKYTEEKDKYNKAISIWNKLFYCGRCDVVYDPLTRVYRSSNYMSNLYHMTPTRTLINLATEYKQKFPDHPGFTLLLLHPGNRCFEAAIEQMTACLEGIRTEPVTDASIGFHTGDDPEIDL